MKFVAPFTLRFYANEKGNFSSGDYGDGFEMLIKYLDGVKAWGCVSPAGKPDYKIGSRHYDVKQNGSPIVYGENTAVAGSSRVIYATHIACTVVAQTAEYRDIYFNIGDTEFFIVDKRAFVKFLRNDPHNLVKENRSRQQINIQTVYNYTTGAPHGKKGQYIREWCYENEVEAEHKERLLEAFWNAVQ